jgi:glycosyltransferase involved in cell wall biosynthesis
MKKGISVLICTRNGEKRLPLTLRHLASQKVAPDISWEVILVDNGSTDSSRELAAEIWTTYRNKVPLLVFAESRPGKDQAMDFGLSKTQYSYVVVCDDDNWLSENYLQDAYDIMEHNPQIGILGGKGIAAFEVQPPAWFSKYEGYYAVGRQSNNITSGELVPQFPKMRFLWGAGAVINAKAYRLLKGAGFNRILTHERHPDCCRSEDVELCLAIRLAGFKMWYDERLTYKHFIPAERLKWNYLLNITKQGALMGAYLLPYNFLICMSNKVKPNSLWKPLIRMWLGYFAKHNRTFTDLKFLLFVLLGVRPEGCHLYQQKLAMCYQFYGVLRLGKSVDGLYSKTLTLKTKVIETIRRSRPVQVPVEI